MIAAATGAVLGAAGVIAAGYGALAAELAVKRADRRRAAPAPAAGRVAPSARAAGEAAGQPEPELTNAPAHAESLELAAEVVSRSQGGYVVLGGDAEVLMANLRATELGLVRAGLADDRLRAAARRAAAGETVDLDLQHAVPADLVGPRPVTASVHVVVRPLSDGKILAVAADESAAQRVEAVRRDFVANVSHELKTPVGAIALLAEAVHDSAGDPETVKHFSGKLLREATRLGSLVTELIALSRLQGTNPLETTAPVQVDDVVDEAVSRVSIVAERAGNTIATDSASRLKVMGDETMLATAVSNLIENAINYSSPGSPVSVSRRLRDGMVEIAVTDRGVGIQPELQERVFERFFRADPARSRATGGTGLGLAIVKHVAASHGGSTGLWSRPGIGSTFTLRLPELADRDVRAANGASSGPATPSSEPAAPAAHAEPDEPQGEA